MVFCTWYLWKEMDSVMARYVGFGVGRGGGWWRWCGMMDGWLVKGREGRQGEGVK